MKPERWVMQREGFIWDTGSSSLYIVLHTCLHLKKNNFSISLCRHETRVFLREKRQKIKKQKLKYILNKIVKYIVLEFCRFINSKYSNFIIHRWSNPKRKSSRSSTWPVTIKSSTKKYRSIYFYVITKNRSFIKKI